MPGNTKTIWVALASNAAILVAKTIGAVAGGSSSLAAEALHSLADTADSVMLIVGTHRAAKPADPTHPFGHGKELYFWTMVVAVSIFAIGGCASVIEGVVHILYPSRIEDPLWTYVVLGLVPGADRNEVKRVYRRLVAEHHPDRLIAKGVPEELIDVATARMQAINLAYSKIIKLPPPRPGA